MPNTVPAANTGLPNLNRRSALAKLGLGLAASASLATASAIAAPAAISPELLRLIEAHKAAYAANQEASRWEEVAQDAYAAIAPEAPPFEDMYGRPAGDFGSKKQPLQMSLGLDECKNRVLENLEFHQRMSRRFEDYASPRRMKQMKAAWRAIEKDSLAAVDAYFVKAAAARQSSGLAVAELDFKRTLAAEGEAMLALCAYRPASLAETRLKGGYLASDHLGYEALTPEHIEALLQSASGEA